MSRRIVAGENDGPGGENDGPGGSRENDGPGGRYAYPPGAVPFTPGPLPGWDDVFVEAEQKTIVADATFPSDGWDPAMRIDRLALTFAASSGWKTSGATIPPFPPGQWKEGASADDVAKSKEAFIEDVASLIALQKKTVDPALDREIKFQANNIISYFMKLASCSNEVRPNTYFLLCLALRIATIVSRHYKAMYMRPRPAQVIPWIDTLIPTPRHPAYPSGHSLQAHLMAEVVKDVTTKAEGQKSTLADRAMTLAERIAKNRELAGVHFPADSSASKNIAPAIWVALKENDETKKELEILLNAAKAEHSGSLQDLPSEALKRIQEAADEAESQKKKTEAEKNNISRPIGPGVA